MKLIVVSDSHGRERGRIEEIIAMHPTYDSLVFLGDGLSDLDYIDTYGHGLLAVRGNCDGFSVSEGIKDELFICLSEYNILMMHGHTFSVKYGLDRAMSYALERGADILLYGHTHTPFERYIPEGTLIGQSVSERPLRVFNPGSIGEGSFGIIEIKNGSVLMSHGTLE